MKKNYVHRLTALTLSILMLFSMLLLPASAAGGAYIESNSYVFVSGVKGDMVLDLCSGGTSATTNVQLYTENNSTAQVFQPVHVRDNYYKIVHVESGRVIDVAGGSSAWGTNVWLYDYNGSDAQLWEFIPAGSGGYYIKSKLGTYLDVCGGGTDNWTNVWAYGYNGGAAQVWYLKPICSVPSVTYLEVVVDNAPIRTDNSSKGNVVARCPSGTVLGSTGTKRNIHMNKWYEVQYGGQICYIYSENVRVKEHRYEYLVFDGVTYHICDCGHVTVSVPTQEKLLLADSIALYASAYGTQYVSEAAVAAGCDGVLPIGDMVSLLILAYGAYSLTTNQEISSTAARTIVTEWDFDDYLKEHKNTCSEASFRMVARNKGSNLTYVGDQCYNAAQAYILARYGADVYTRYWPNAYAAASLHPQGTYSEIDKNQPDYYYHYHLGKDKTQKIGGHIFYGTTPSGLTPS